MKKIFVPLALSLAMTASLSSCTNSTPQLETMKDTLSWAMGRSLAEGLVQNSVADLDKDVVLAAVQSTLNGKDQPISDSIYNAAVEYLQMAMMMQQQNEIQQQTQKVASQEDQYFAKLDSENPNIKKTQSGIRYEVMKSGEGRNAKFGDVAVFDYRGYNMFTGEMIDQTYGQRSSIQHVIGRPMFEGLIEGLQLMNVGSQFRFYFPNKLAFGATGSRNIPPYTPVIYEVELHKIVR